MAVRARFFVSSITSYAHQPEQREVKMVAVSRGEANKEWSKYTPSGELRMLINNPDASDQLKIGVEYDLTFEEAAPDA